MALIGKVRALLARSEAMRTMATSAVIVLVRVGGTLLTFVYTFLIARTMEPEAVGVVWSIWSASFIVSTFATLNIGAGSVREIVKALAEGDKHLAAGFVMVGRFVLLLASPIAIVAWLVVYGLSDPQHFNTYLWAYILSAISLPIMGWVQVNASHAAALNRALYSQAPRELLRPLVFVIALGAALYLGFKPGVEFVIGLYLVAIISTAALQALLLRRAFAFMSGTTPDTSRRWHWIATGLMMTPSRVLGEHLKNLVIVVGAWGLGQADVAKLAVGLSLIGLLNFGISAVDMTFSPKVSSAIVTGQVRRRDTMLAVASLVKVIPVGLATLLLVLFTGPILSIFGPAYVDAAPAVLWFLLMPVSKSIFGPADLVLQVAGQRRAILLIASFGIVAMAVLTPIAGQAYGLTAAAAAASISYAVAQATMWTVSRVTTGVDTSIIAALRTVLSRRTSRG